MTNHIIPKVAYIPREFTLSVDDFLKMWEEETSGQEGKPTQKTMIHSCVLLLKMLSILCVVILKAIFV